MVLAAITLVMVMMMLAFVVDLSRLYVQKNELQTGTDAGALAGALRLSTTTSNVSDSAVATGNRNFVLGTAPTFLASAVKCGVWDGLPINGSTPNAWHSGSPHDLPCVASDNAVQLGGASPSNYLFNGILNAAGVTVATTAVAWVAPAVSSTTCIKPFAVDYKYLIQALDAVRGIAYDSLNHAVAYRDLADADFPFLRATTNALKFCMKDATTNNPKCPNTALTSGSFGEADLNPDNGNSTQQYKSLIVNPCDDVVPIGPGALVSVKTGNSQVPTVKSVQAWCDYLAGSQQPCLMKFVMYDPSTPIPAAPNNIATNQTACGGGGTGSTVCYVTKMIGAGIADRPANGDKIVTGAFTLANDPQGSIGTTRGLLYRVILVQ
jgi:hypothetical protein